jgi:hypothetical protein
MGRFGYKEIIMKKYLLPILLIAFWSCEEEVAEPLPYIECKSISTKKPGLGWGSHVVIEYYDEAPYNPWNSGYEYLHLYKSDKYFDAGRTDGSVFTYDLTDVTYTYVPL